MSWKDPFKALLQVVSNDYWNGWLYVIEPNGTAVPSADVVCGAIDDVAEIARSGDLELARQAGIREPDTAVFGAWDHDRLVAVCWFQSRNAHRRRRGLLVLADDEAELAQITTASTHRGRGVASQLIQYGAHQMGAMGFRRLYAKVWHDNRSSRRAFERAGWHLVKRFVGIRVRGATRALMLTLPARRQPTS